MRSFRHRGLIGSSLVLALLTCPAAAEEVSKEACLACHGMEAFSTPAGRSLFVDVDTFGASVHGAFSCMVCHMQTTSIPHAEAPERPGAEECAACHGDVVATYRESIHGQARAKGNNEAAICSNCHGPAHGMKRSRDHASPVYQLNLPRTCGVCHGDPQLAKRHGISDTSAYQLYMDSVHGRAVTRSGLLVAANCSSCHGAHEIRPKGDSASKVHRTNIPSTCGSCHAGVLDAYVGDIHGEALNAGRRGAPVCVDCHTPHHIIRVERVDWQLEIIRECGTCHEESLTTYRDTFHGQVTSLGFTRVARCSDCHGSHGIFPASDTRSSVASANLVETCQRCHAGASESFVLFSPHADHRDRERNPGLYYSAIFMHTLIIGVFVFFGVHTVLWLSRSLVGQARAGKPAAGS